MTRQAGSGHRRAAVLGVLLGLLWPALLAQYAWRPPATLFQPDHLPAPRALLEDADGILWMGSAEGLWRYDGARLRMIPSDRPRHVTALGQDAAGLIWAGCEDGSVCRLIRDSLLAWEPEEGTPARRITGIVFDPAGVMWISTYGEGVYGFNGVHLYQFGTEDGLPDLVVYGMLNGPAGEVWCGTDAGAAACRLDEAGRKSVQRLTPAQGLPDHIVRALLASPDGAVWIGGYDAGVCRYEPARNAWTYLPADEPWHDGPVTAMARAGDELWIGTESGSLLMLDAATLRLRRRDTASRGAVHALLYDQEGNLWASSARKGLQWTFPRLQRVTGAPARVQALYAGADRQTLWAADPTGLYALRGDPLQPVIQGYAVQPGPGGIISMWQDASEQLWLGTFDRGIIRLDPDRGQIRTLREREGLPDGSVWAIAGDRQQVWLSTLGGAARSQEPPFGAFRPETGPGAAYLYDIHPDRQGRVWFAADGKGIICYEKGQFVSYAAQAGLGSTTVYSILEDPAGHIWFNAADSGLYRYDGQQFTRTGPRQGLRNGLIASFAHDPEGRILAAHSGGLDLYDPAAQQWQYFSGNIGDEAFSPELNAAVLDSAGRIWIGTREGLLCYQSGYPARRTAPRLYLAPPRILLTEYSDTARHVYAYAENHLTFTFSGLWFREPEAVTYQYRLLGYDLDWIDTRDFQVTYPRLAPGSYTFELRCALYGQQADLIRYSFRVRPPFWLTWWFLGLCMLTLAALAWAWVHVRERRLRERARLEQENIRFEFETLRSQVNPHFLFNAFNTLAAIIEAEPAAAVEYVNKLSDLFRNMLSHREKPLISLAEELQVAETYIYLQRRRYGGSLRIELSVPESAKNRTLPPLTLQLLIENAIKHNVISQTHPLTVIVEAGQEDTLTVRNEIRLKRSPVASTRLGLDNIRQRYRLLSDRPVQITDAGGVFTVSVPLLDPR